MGGGWLLATLFAAPFGLSFSAQWDTALRFFWSQPVGRSDPIFGRDLGFHLFELPFLEVLQNNLTTIAFLAFIGVLGLSILTSVASGNKQGIPLPAKSFSRHLTVTSLLFLAGFAWGYILDRYELLYSSRGVVHGDGDTDLQVVHIALWTMAGASVLLGLIILLGYWRNRLKFPLWGGAGYVVLLIASLMIAPLAVQKFIVEPNELDLETPFLEHEIAFTREAFGIDQLEEKSYRALSDPTVEELGKNEKTLRNIRLWDWRPLLQTFRQLQEIRTYYQFYQVDVDRYQLDGEYRQVMLSARELDRDLPKHADTWVNHTLQFTHGYGLAMSFASQEGEEGTPKFMIQDLPPRISRGLEVEKPAIFRQYLSGEVVFQ